MRLVKWLTGLALVATLIWGGLWFLGARALDMALDRVLDTPNAPLGAEGHAVRGFPNRFDITLTQPRVSTGALDWSAPFVQVFSLVYRPHHVIVVFPPEQRLRLLSGDGVISSTDTRASVVMRPTENLTLDRIVLVAQQPVLNLPGERLSADTLRAALRPAGDWQAEGPGRYDAVIEVEAGFPDPRVMDLIDPGRHLPRRYDVLRLDGELRFDAALDLDALSSSRPPALAEYALTGARAAFDGIDLNATGRVVPDAQGRPSGEVTVTVIGWEALADLLTAAGLLTPEGLAWVRLAAPGLTRADGSGAIDIPLRLADGQLLLGGLVLAELP